MAGEWRNGLFSHICGADTCNLCLGAWCCSCCLYGKIDQRLESFPETDREFSNCTGSCWLFCAASYCGLQWVPLLLKRTDVRNRFSVSGDGCKDCLAAFFCTPCALAQLDTELKDRAKNQAVIGNKEAYQPQQGGMNYAPQY